MSVGTIPVRGERFLERPSSKPKGFGSSASRFRGRDDDLQFYMMSGKSAKQIMPLRRKAQPFISQGARFEKSKSFGPGPGYYEVNKKPSLTGTVMLSSLRDNFTSGLKAPPPGAYNPRDSAKAIAITSSFASKVKRFSASQDMRPRLIASGYAQHRLADTISRNTHSSQKSRTYAAYNDYKY